MAGVAGVTGTSGFAWAKLTPLKTKLVKAMTKSVSMGLTGSPLFALVEASPGSNKWGSRLTSHRDAQEALGTDVARGLSLHCDWGPQYVADAWINEVKWLGCTI